MKTYTGYLIVEKKNHYAVHGIFHSLERAENHLKTIIPEYIKKSYFTDKTLKADSFEIIKKEK